MQPPEQGNYASIVKNFFILCASILICECLQASVTLRFHCSIHESHFVHLEHGFEQILTTVVENAFELRVAWVVVETAIV